MEKSLCLATPAQHFFLLWDFLLGCFRAGREKKGYWSNLMCFANDFGWLKLLSKGRALSRKSPAPHWGIMKGPMMGPWALQFFLGIIFPTRRNAHHQLPKSWGQDHQTSQWCAPPGRNSKAEQKNDGWFYMNNSRDWWVDTGLFSFGRLKIYFK